MMVNNKINWFENWFDSPYYHLLYNNRDLSEAESFINYLCNYLNLTPGAKILDLACGKGRHALSLHKKGFNVTGFDLSENSIQEAKKQEKENLGFYIHDMRKEFPLKGFDAVLNLFSSFGYFKTEHEHSKTLNNIYSCLNKNGIFVLDFMNINKVIENLIPNEIQYREDICFKISRKTENGFLIKNIEVENQHQKLNFQESVMLLDYSKLKIWFENNNFKIIKLMGNYKLETFDIKNSDRLIIHAQKN